MLQQKKIVSLGAQILILDVGIITLKLCNSEIEENEIQQH